MSADAATEVGPLWKPFNTTELITMGRCPGCGWSPREQGHSPRCPVHPDQEPS